MWLPESAVEVRMIPLAEGVGLAGITMIAILEMISARRIHWAQGGTCTPLICLKSLIESLTSSDVKPL